MLIDAKWCHTVSKWWCVGVCMIDAKWCHTVSKWWCIGVCMRVWRDSCTAVLNKLFCVYGKWLMQLKIFSLWMLGCSESVRLNASQPNHLSCMMMPYCLLISTLYWHASTLTVLFLLEVTFVHDKSLLMIILNHFDAVPECDRMKYLLE